MKNRDYTIEPNKQLELLIDFINSDMTPSEFITQNKEFSDSSLANSEELSEEEIAQTNSYKHEKEHALAWKRHGIES
jgi:hypothetical protein